MAKKPSEIETMKKEATAALRAYARAMGKEFGRIEAEMAELIELVEPSRQEVARLNRLEGLEEKHAKHLDTLIEILNALKPDENSYA